MLLKLSDRVREAQEHAAAYAELAKSATNEDQRRTMLALEIGWDRVAQCLMLIERLSLLTHSKPPKPH